MSLLQHFKKEVAAFVSATHQLKQNDRQSEYAAKNSQHAVLNAVHGQGFKIPEGKQTFLFLQLSLVGGVIPGGRNLRNSARVLDGRHIPGI